MVIMPILFLFITHPCKSAPSAVQKYMYRENLNKNCTYDTRFRRLLRLSSLRDRGTGVGIRKSSASRTPPPKAENTNI